MSTYPARDARVAPYGALALRLALGVAFLAQALSKALVFTLPGTAAFFERHGFPGWTAYPVFVLELIGGLLLLSGVGSRWAALVLIPVTAGALLVHWPNGWLSCSPRCRAASTSGCGSSRRTSRRSADPDGPVRIEVSFLEAHHV